VRNRSVLPLLAATVLAATTSCSRGPVDWNDAAQLPARLAGAPELAFDASGQLVARTPPPVTLPVFLEQCAATVRVSGDSTSGWSAVWWSVRRDSTADLVVSRSTDGVTWSAPARVDSTDTHASGCNRVPAGLFVDGADVHIVYAMNASEGAGIFVAHSMDGGATFHTPVAVAYGAEPGRAAIAARGDLVVVAYEDPNATPPRIALAISRTGGHLFEPSVIASPPTGEALAPGVALGDGIVAVTWSTDSVNASGPRIVRTGTIR
jgi:hypothetical protein